MMAVPPATSLRDPAHDLEKPGQDGAQLDGVYAEH